MESIYSRFNIFFTLTLLFFCCNAAFSQVPVTDNTLLKESFSGNSFPANWSETSSTSFNWKVVQGINSIEDQPQASALNLEKSSPKEESNINVWAFTRGMSLKPGIIYTIRFAIQNKAKGQPGVFRLTVNTTQNHSTGTIIAINSIPGDMPWTEMSYSFTVNQERTYFIGFGVTELKSSSNISIDEVHVLVPGIREFYNKQLSDQSVPDLNLLTSWGANRDGSGPQPMNFSDANQRFNVINYTSGGKAKLGKDWDVTGMGSKVILGNGTTPVEMTLADKKSITSGPIDVANNATLIIDAPLLPAFGQLHTNSTVVLGKLAPTDINANVVFANLVIESSKKNKLAKKVTINGKLDLKAGKIELGDFDVEIGYGGAIINGSPDNYIIADGKGRVRHGIKANQEVIIPVGTATAYNPIKIKAASTSQDDIFSVRVIEGIYASYVYDVPVASAPLTINKVNKTWLIDEDVKGGSNITLTLSWTLREALLGFALNECYIEHYEHGTWDSYITSKASLTMAGMMPMYSISRPGIRSFSPFGVGSGSAITPMPVEFISFSAQPTAAGNVNLNWATAQEQDSDYFEVERSTNGKDFELVGKVNAKGSTNQRTDYTFTDNSLLGSISYYRLRQVDLDGTYTYTAVKEVNVKTLLKPTLKVYPNPSNGSDINILVQGAIQSNKAMLMLNDLSGKTILKSELTSERYTLPAHSLKPGTYILSIVGKESLVTQKVVVQ